MNHCSSEQLQEYLDGRLKGEEHAVVHDHLAACVHCKTAYQALSRVDMSLRNLPIESVPPAFTQLIMSRVEALSLSPAWYKLLGGIGYLLALLFVVGVMAVMLTLGGAVSSDQVARTESFIRGLISEGGSGISMIAAGIRDVLKQFFPFIYGKESLGIILFGLLLALLLAGVDRLLQRRFVHRA